MARPGRTFDAHVMVGTNAWLIDLTPEVTSLNVNGSTNITRQPGLGRRFEAATFNTGTHVIDVPTLYVGEESEALRMRQGSGDTPWVCVADPAVGLMYAMQGLLTGLPENAPTSDVIATAINFPQADRMIAQYKAGAQTEFSLADGTESMPIGAIEIGDSVILVVTSLTGAPGAGYSVTVDGRQTQMITVPGIWDLGKATAADASPTISVPDAEMDSADDTLKGFVLIGKEVGA